MGIEITVSSKGQIVIPRDVRTALGIEPGAKLTLERIGRQIVLEAPEAPRERISYEEFRRRVPRYEGPPATLDDMRASIDELFRRSPEE